MRILRDLWRFALRRKKFWLFPLMIMAVIYGALAVFTKGSVVAPFIYTLFWARCVPYGRHIDFYQTAVSGLLVQRTANVT